MNEDLEAKRKLDLWLEFRAGADQKRPWLRNAASDRLLTARKAANRSLGILTGVGSSPHLLLNNVRNPELFHSTGHTTTLDLGLLVAVWRRGLVKLGKGGGETRRGRSQHHTTPPPDMGEI